MARPVQLREEKQSVIQTGETMENKTFKILELVGTSPNSIEEAINGAVKRADETVRNMGWFEVKEIRGAICEGRVAEYQVKFVSGFRLEGKD